MTDQQPIAAQTRVFIACSEEFRNRKAIMEALGSIFLDTIDGQREYFYFDCPALTEIFDDGVFNRSAFRRLNSGDPKDASTLRSLNFTHIVAGGDDTFVKALVSNLGAPEAAIVRLM
ncbi:hypothetical protein [Hyphomicrobium facile]|uniref:Uncharacterized protein n=1 Tax=Hyphomicrobium facile TaxID=51670 RepID=A0A1I7NC20_9HYPH|nr:hypothetical protein [Hyphomicrobium facile]SFV32230.1 hypothetical protein SAMN04488557_1525 [Hyphomicrobium facile]